VNRIVFLATLSVFIFQNAGLAAENHQGEELFFKANQAYKQGKFQDASTAYQQLIESGHSSGHLYYNLGNCYMRLGQLGAAILSYERARLLLPRDPDLDFNLRYARDQIVDEMVESGSLLNTTFFWLKSLNTVELFWGFAIINCLFWAVLLVRVFVRPEWTYYLSLVLLIFWLIVGVSFGLKRYQTVSDDRAVILQQEIDVLAGPDIQDTVLFKLHEGTMVYQEREEGDWSLIRFPDGKRGWTKSDTLERIIW
jgi:tetratricopeptide (TPR) repeat protein